jgi:hypothetical protein
MNPDQMMQAPAIYFLWVPDTQQQASYGQQVPHQTTYMPQTPILPQQPKQQQQAEQQPKQQTSHKQKRAPAALTMTTGYPGRKSAEEATKEQVRKQPEYQHSKEQTTAQLI